MKLIQYSYHSVINGVVSSFYTAKQTFHFLNYHPAAFAKEIHCSFQEVFKLIRDVPLKVFESLFCVSYLFVMDIQLFVMDMQFFSHGYATFCGRYAIFCFVNKIKPFPSGHIVQTSMGPWQDGGKKIAYNHYEKLHIHLKTLFLSRL